MKGVTVSVPTPGGVDFLLLMVKAISVSISDPSGREETHLYPDFVRTVPHFQPRVCVVIEVPFGVLTKTPNSFATSKPLLKIFAMSGSDLPG